jgi:hypothetical protein
MSLSPEHPGLTYSILKNSIKHKNVMGIRAAMALCVKPSLENRRSSSFVRARVGSRTVCGTVAMTTVRGVRATRGRAVSARAMERRRTDGGMKTMGRPSTSTAKARTTTVRAPGADEDVTRRAMLGGKIAFVFGEAIAFPWLTESATRPKAPGDDALTPLSAAWARSLLPAERDVEAMRAANEALEKGERALNEGDTGRAIEELSKIEGLVPREYKLNQRAGLALSEAHKLAGNNESYLEYKNRVWWWGRGLRWPGWYIIAYLSARSAYFDAKDDDDATFTMQEAGILVVVWIGLLFLLVEYGLPDYQI